MITENDLLAIIYQNLPTRYGRNVTERSVQGTSEVENDDGVSVVKILLDHKADINKKDVYEFTPLHHASLRYSYSSNFVISPKICSFRGNIKVVEFLLQQPNLKINIADAQGVTSLHVAATYNNKKVVKMLLGSIDVKIFMNITS